MRLAALLVAALVGVGGACPTDCECSYGDVITVECAHLVLKARDDGFMEIDCQGNPWNCSSIPTMDIGHHTLRRLEVTRCTAPVEDSGNDFEFSCALHTAGASDAQTLAMADARSELTAENVRGLNLTSVYMASAPGVQTTIPLAAIKSLPSLRTVRLLSLSSPPLYPDMFIPSPPIQLLEVSMSGVKELPANAFRGLNELKILSLWKNDISRIDVNAFAGLPSLLDLRLNSNPFGSLPSLVFRALPRLRRLCLERVPLAAVTDGLFDGLDDLQEIKFYNDVQLELSPYAFANLPSLTSLLLPSSHISTLPPTIFQNTSNIVNLTLNNNQIKIIPEGLFSNLIALEKLDLSRNKIETVSKAMFENLRSLKEVKLDGNKIETLPDRLFSGLTHLTSISLSHNTISFVSWGAFLGIESVSRLDLSWNKLAWDCSERGQILVGDASSPLSRLLALKDLSLRGNNLTCIFSDWRFVLLSLTRLDLAYNNYTELTVSDVQFFQSSIEVDFRHNQITTFSPYSYYSTVPPSVRVLFDDNPFDCTCTLYFFLTQINQTDQYDVKHAKCHSPPSLKNQQLSKVDTMDITCPVLNTTSACNCLIRPAKVRIECDCSELDELPDPTENGLNSMSLRLRSVSNDLQSLPEYVSEVNLSGLFLQTLPKIPVTVTHLDLSNNRIKKIPAEFLNENLTLMLSGNPLECDCWSVNDVISLKNNSKHIADYKDVTCYPNRRLTVLDPYALCNYYKSTVTVVLVAVLVILLVLLTAILYAYKIEIQVYLYSKRICLFLLPKEVKDFDKTHDVFVSFAPEDEKFVCQEILPNLKGRYVLHVQDRDWEVGDTIPNQIRQSVEASSRTLIIFSDNFLRSVWAMEVLRCVHTQAASDKRARAVVVNYKLNKQLDKDTKTYLSLSTRIKWTDKMFWNKVFYALPRKDMYEQNNELKVFKKKKINDFSVNKYSDTLAVPVWKGDYLNVILNEEGKLVNAGLKD